MTDRPDQFPPEDESPELTEVRRLLAEARHTEPMPDDVAERMHRVLDRLGDETPAARSEPSTGVVIPIAAHRRRRAAGLLVAAAAIVVGGVVVTQNVSSSGERGATAGSQAQADSTNGGRSAQSGTTGEQPQEPQTYSKEQATPGTETQGVRLRHGRVVVRSQHFTADALSSRALLERSDSSAKAHQLTLLQDCPVRETAGGRTLAAEYRRAPAALVFRRPEGGAQVVDLVVCGSSTPIRTTTLPAP